MKKKGEKTSKYFAGSHGVRELGLLKSGKTKRRPENDFQKKGKGKVESINQAFGLAREPQSTIPGSARVRSTPSRTSCP